MPMMSRTTVTAATTLTRWLLIGVSDIAEQLSILYATLLTFIHEPA